MNQLVKRYLTFTIGLYLLSLGIVLIVQSSLGTTPISSINYVVSLNTPLSLGVSTFCLNMLLIIGQFWLISGEMMNKKNVTEVLLQIPFSFVFSSFIDINMTLLHHVHPTNYFMSIALLIAGCLIQSTGVVLEVKPQVTMMSAEGVVNYASKRYDKEFGKMKRWFDIALVTTAAIISLILAHQLQGVREGTLVSALITGPTVTFLSLHVLTWRNLNRLKSLLVAS